MIWDLQTFFNFLSVSTCQIALFLAKSLQKIDRKLWNSADDCHCSKLIYAGAPNSNIGLFFGLLIVLYP